MNSCDSESLPEESRGGEPREQGSVGITSPLLDRAVGTPTSGSKTTLQSSKARNTYHRVLQSSGIEKSIDHNPGQAKDDSHRTSGVKHTMQKQTLGTHLLRQRSSRNTEATTRDQSLKTSTNIPDLHKVEKEQPGVTTRDTEQPCEKQHLTTGTAPSDLRKVEGPQAEPPCTSGTPRGQGTTPYSATTDGTKERGHRDKTQVTSGKHTATTLVTIGKQVATRQHVVTSNRVAT
ncbi:hypothetical protein Taro_050790 [Colocasia esculenta]|uniref:Uncharacterized protein n=1 Tax=Colocasia esculenta TaxID=4460 RepID=A0A843XEW9_COLES|nr:hypothetical protein [Colocasia esculenta]